MTAAGPAPANAVQRPSRARQPARQGQHRLRRTRPHSGLAHFRPFIDARHDLAAGIVAGYGFGCVMAGVAGMLAIAALAVTRIGGETRGLALDQIAPISD
jgi:hypothetical protein